MVAFGFAGAVSKGANAAWPLFGAGMLAFFPVLQALVGSFGAAAKSKGPKTGALYSKLAILLGVTWCAYPAIWAISEGGQR